MPERGEVRAVAWMPQGSELAADVALGALQLTITNPVDFDEDGGTLDLNGAQLDYSTIDMDTGIITLVSATTAAATAGDRVNVVSGGQVAIDYVAFTSLGDGDEIEVVIPFAERDLWPEGEYDSPVVVDLSDDLERLVAVPGRTPLRDGTFIDPSTLPPPVLPPASDGLAPSSSPAPTVIGGIGAMFARWTGVVNADPVTYEVHLSLTNAGVSLGDGTSVARTSATAITLRALADGTPVVTGTTYYVSLIAFDVDGAAGASSPVAGVPMQITGPDIQAESITGNLIQGGTITGDLFSAQTVLSGEFTTGTQGQRARMSSEGFQVFGPDGSVMVDLPAIQYDPANPNVTRPEDLKGTAELQAVTTSGLTIQGSSSGIATGASMQLAAGVQASNQGPSAAIDYPTAPYTAQQLAQVRGWARSDVNGQEAWVQAFYGAARLCVWFGGVVEQYDLGTFNPFGIVHHFSGNGWIVVGQDNNTKLWQARRYQITRTGTPTLTLVSQSAAGSAFWGGPVNVWSQTTVGMQFNDTQTFYLASLVYAGAPNGQVEVRKYRQSDYSLVNAPLLTQFPSNSASDVTSLGPVQYGLHDGIAGNVYYVAHYDTMFCFSASAGNPRLSQYDFPLPAAGGIMQVTSYKQTAADTYVFDGWKQLSTDASTVTSFSTANMWTATNDKYWWASYAWWNGVNGRHTTPSASTLVQMKKRARLTLTSNAIPVGDPTGDPDSVRFFVGKGTATTPPASSASWWQTDPTPADPTIQITSVLFSGSSASAIAPSNTFPTALGGVIKGAGQRLDLTPKVSIAGRGDANLDGLIPPGSMIMSGGASAPPGWLLCDGSAQSRAALPDLFAAIGTRFGAGDGSTTFNLPDMRTRLPIGVGALGSIGGTEGGAVEGTGRTTRMDHRHSHTASALQTDTSGSGHTHTLDLVADVLTVTRQTNTTTGGSAQRVSELAGSVTGNHQHLGSVTNSVGGHSHTTITGSTDQGAMAAGLIANHPFTLLYFIIKT
jgi:microcystin-dependent protein